MLNKFTFESEGLTGDYVTFNFKPFQNEYKYDIVFTQARYYRKTYIHDYTF